MAANAANVAEEAVWASLRAQYGGDHSVISLLDCNGLVVWILRRRSADGKIYATRGDGKVGVLLDVEQGEGLYRLSGKLYNEERNSTGKRILFVYIPNGLNWLGRRRLNAQAVIQGYEGPVDDDLELKYKLILRRQR
eukprot:m.153011 g.153011  ORF g.153011 m.153011 type:complete len:137 (-) comp14277_c0_seq1:229-639(-)